MPDAEPITVEALIRIGGRLILNGHFVRFASTAKPYRTVDIEIPGVPVDSPLALTEWAWHKDEGGEGGFQRRNPRTVPQNMEQAIQQLRAWQMDITETNE